jgi:tetratricopeptide (TPR) repeat protein
MARTRACIFSLGIFGAVYCLPTPTVIHAQTATTTDADALYRQRGDLTSAKRAADLWKARAGRDFDAAWKLSRVSYWIGTRESEADRRRALEVGIEAGEGAIRLASNRPEGHFWLAANMGELAESFGMIQGLKYRGRIKTELEQVLSIDPRWQGGSADAALGRWYFEVPRVLGGSRAKAEEHLRRALSYDSENRVALDGLAEVLTADGRRDEARALLRRLVDAAPDPEWIPEDLAYKQKAVLRLRALAR